MTPKKFVSTIEEFYGQYKLLQSQVVENWASQRTDEYLTLLLQTLFEQYSARYGIPPGIPEFRGVTDEVLTKIENRQAQRRQLQNMSEKRLLLTGSSGGEWEEVEYNGRKMTRAAAYLEAIIEGMAQGIHPKRNLKAKNIMEAIS
jgi:hypothetical protein